MANTFPKTIQYIVKSSLHWDKHDKTKRNLWQNENHNYVFLFNSLYTFWGQTQI